MLQKISIWLSEKMIEQDIISEDEKEYYEYAISVNIEKITGFLILGAIALILSEIVGMIVFSVSFICLRKYSGGYHCKTEIGCFILSFIVIFLSVETAGLINICASACSIVILISCMIIVSVGAINNPQINWDDEQLSYAKKKTRQCAIVETVIFEFLLLFEKTVPIVRYGMIAIVLSAVTLMIRLAERRYRNEQCKESIKSCKKGC